MMGVGAKRALGLYRSCAPRHPFDASARLIGGRFVGLVANTDIKLLIYGRFQKSRVLAQDELLAANNAFFLHHVIVSVAWRRQRAEFPPQRRQVRGTSLSWLSARQYAIFFFCRSHPPGSLPLWNDHLLDVTQAPETLQSCVTLHNALRLATGAHRLCFIRVVGQMTTERLDIDTRKSQ